MLTRGHSWGAKARDFWLSLAAKAMPRPNRPGDGDQKSELKRCPFKASCSGGRLSVWELEGYKVSKESAINSQLLSGLYSRPFGPANRPGLNFKRTYVTIHLAGEFHREIPNRFEPFHALRIRRLQVLR